MRLVAQAGMFLTAAALGFHIPAATGAELDLETQQQLRDLRQQNEQLQQQMRRQQELIDELSKKVAAIQSNGPSSSSTGKSDVEAGGASRPPLTSGLGKAILSGEGAVGFFESQSHGQFPNSEFHIDEAKLFLDAPVWKEVYFFTELNLLTREDPDFDLRVGELYVDVENLSRLWNKDGQLNLRFGRLDIPFGEEYLSRDAIDNPLISHSIMDFWGVDEGVELYGALGKFQYVVAVQNGSHDSLRDFTSDKAVAARVGYDPARWLHLSASAMRTGEIDVEKEYLSELWIGPGFVHSVGSPQTTRFKADVFQGDVQLKLGRTIVKASGGALQYRDNDPRGENRRDVFFYSVEATQQLYKGLYAAGRWSQAFAHKGFPIIGNGSGKEYFAKELTSDLSLLSLGLGYRWSPQLVLKMEYSFEWGRELSGSARENENLFAIQAAFAF